MRIAVAIPAGGLVVGCAFGLCWPDPATSLLLFFLIGSAAASAWAFRTGSVQILATAIALSFAAGGWLLSVHAWHRAWRSTLRVAFESIARDERANALKRGQLRPEDDSASVVVVGVLRSDAAPTAGGGVSLNLATTWIGRLRSSEGRYDPAANPVDGGALLTVAGTMATAHIDQWRRGRTVRVSAQLHRPATYLDPGVPDQERILARRGVALVGTVKSSALVEVVARGSIASERAASLRAFARHAIESSVSRWSPRSAGIVRAIVIGDRTGLDDEVERRLQEAGTYHVIAISGGNIAILAGLTLVVFRMAGFLGRTAMLSAISGLMAYGYLVGGGASVDRATLMAVVYFAGRAIDLRGPPANALVLVAGLLLAADPLAVADPAFLLTCGATASILIAVPAFPLPRLARWLLPVAAVFVASAAAEAALLPVAATIFSRVTFAGLALNFAAIPLMAVAQIAGMVLVPLFGVSSVLAAGVGLIAHLGAEGLVATADLVRLTPIVTWRVAPPPLLASTIYYVAGIGAWTLWRISVRRGSAESSSVRSLRRGSLLLVALAACWILVEPSHLLDARGDGRLHVTFIDVGQGDAALVRFPRGATVLVDAGGLPGSQSFDIGDRVVAPVLRHAGVRRLGTVTLTHADADHVGGAVATIREFRPWEIWEGIPVPPSLALQSIHDAAQPVRSRTLYVQTDDLAEIDGVRMVVRHPGQPDWERQDVRNNDSIVLELLWQDVSVVLTGDIGAEVEREIASRFRPVPIRIVKVPHHGSLTSSSEHFLKALAPRVAVVSVGRSNHFGHPAPAVLQRYRDVGAQIFRTDQDGAVTLDTDGNTVSIRTFTGRRVDISSTPVHHEGTEATKNTKNTKRSVAGRPAKPADS